MTAVLLAVFAAVGVPCGCTADETCCQADGGFVCCVTEVTSCVEEAAGGLYPSRCCPKWTVGCQVGSVGCCDPAQPWQRLIGPKNVGNRSDLPSSVNVVGKTTPTQMVYALFITGFNKILSCLTLTIDAKITSNQPVTGVAAEWYARWYGQGTRVFPFDEKRVAYHFVDSPNNTADITLYTIDAQTGGSSSHSVMTELKVSISGYPLGMTWLPEYDRLAFSTLSDDTYTFYSVSVAAGYAAKLGTAHRNSTLGELDASFYSGYFSGVGLDGKSILRLGYKSVTSQAGFGFFNTSLGKDSATEFNPMSPPPTAHDFYSFNRKEGTDIFYSLAPSLSNDDSFAVYKWSNSMPVTFLAQLDNAYPPTMSSLGTLGYVGTAVSQYTFVSIVMSHTSSGQKWAIAAVDLGNNKPETNEFDPQFALPGGCGLSGIGIAQIV